MIAVVGLNTAIDKLLDVDSLGQGLVVRAREVRAWPGGKGVHAALCAAVLDADVRLTGVIDAAHRESFTMWLGARGVEFHGIERAAPIRTCLAIRDRAGGITEILEPGAAIDADGCRDVFETALAGCERAGVAVLSGSLPPGMSPHTYRDLVGRLSGTRVIVDASGDLLRHALEARPFAVKPNRAEAEALTGITLDSPASAARGAQGLASSGIPLIVISLGAEGAVASWGGRAYHVSPPQVDALNAVGAGDCLVGALAAGVARGEEIVDALRLGVAAGTAKVLSAETGIVRREHIDAVLPATRVTRIH
jgi:1-phosphofructokinase family hexose kinase